MPDPDDVASTLAEWGKLTRAATIGPWEKLGLDDIWSQPAGRHVAETMNREADAEFIVTARTAMPVLLAALEAVLKATGKWERESVRLDGLAAGDPDPQSRIAISLRAQAFEDCTRTLREAITTALTAGNARD